VFEDGGEGEGEDKDIEDEEEMNDRHHEGDDGGDDAEESEWLSSTGESISAMIIVNGSRSLEKIKDDGRICVVGELGNGIQESRAEDYQ
jgi:hypothetical protein